MNIKDEPAERVTQACLVSPLGEVRVGGFGGAKLLERAG